MADRRVVLAAVAGGLVGWLACRLSQRGARRRARKSGRVFVGIDLGGTTISAALCDEHGAVLGSSAAAIAPGARSPEAVVDAMASLARAAARAASRSLGDAAAIGIGAPGISDTSAGVIKGAAAFEGWADVPLAPMLARACGGGARAPTFLENDANCALLAECWSGAARGRRNVSMLTLGTGVGGGCLVDGRLPRGATGNFAEVGHTIVRAGGRLERGSGVRGVLQAYCSATAVAEAYAEARGAAAPWRRDEADCAEVFRRAAAGDEVARRTVDEAAEYVAIGCINLCRGVDPEMIVLAGGVTRAGEQLVGRVRHWFREHYWTIQPATCEIALAQQGDLAGAIGAAAAARARLDGDL